MEWFIFAILSAVFLSAYNIIRKKALRKEHSTELLASIFVTIAVIQLVYLPFLDWHLSLRIFGMIIIRSVLASLAWLLLTKAIHHMELSSVAPMTNLSPLFLLFLSYIFLGERVNLVQIIGIFLVMAGGYFIQIHDHYLDFFRHIKEFRNKYFIFTIAAVFLLALSAVFSKKIVDSIPVTDYLFFTYLFSALFFLGILLFKYDGFKDLSKGLRDSPVFVPAAAVALILADYLHFSALSLGMVTLVVPIRRLSTLFTTIIGGRMFHENHLVHKIISTVILVTGAALIIMG
ncbi:MAG: EamA family transporter [Nanobdellota archaeon]